MQNDKQQGGQSQGSQQGKRSQTDLDSIIRQGKWGSQSDANSYLKQHGLSCELRDDGTAEIFDDQNNRQRVATVRFDQQSGGKQDSQSGQSQRGNVSGIDYT